MDKDSHTNKKQALILVNVGTPDAPTVKATRKYLGEFLNDPFVIDIPAFFRYILVNGIIVPFRAPKSAKKYQEIWTENGSPLLIHMNELTRKMNQNTDENIDVYGVMRYGNPSLEKLLHEIKVLKYETITIVPLYPQYAESTGGTVKRLVYEKLQKSNPAFPVTFIPQFYNSEPFLETLSSRISMCKPEEFDHILFSYHGLPERQVEKCHPGHKISECSCEREMPDYGTSCYRATCYATTRMIAKKLKLKEGEYSTAFQSRLSKNWMRPFADETLLKLAEEGKLSVLVVPASFVADCLETLLEIEMEYKEMFIDAGGKRFQMTKSMNSGTDWATALIEIISSKQAIFL